MRASETVLYRPLIQNTPNDFWLVAQSASDDSAADIAQAIRRGALRVDRDIPIESIDSLEVIQQAWIDDTGTDDLGQLSVGLAVITLVLAVIGIYGVVSRSVSARTNEIGIRRALGSSNLNVISLFMKQGSRYLIIGVILGGGSAILVGNALSNLLSDTISILPSVFVAVVLVLGLLIFSACYIPARKAVTMEPGEALHYE